MDKKTRYRPASFLEVDDLFGGRKVVMVGADGITYWDALDVDNVTPIVIHPVFKPKEIGALIEFARKNDLLDALRILTVLIGERAQTDPLYVMRALVAYSTGPCDGSDAELRRAIQSAEAEEKRALEMQEVVEKYVEVTDGGNGSHGAG